MSDQAQGDDVSFPTDCESCGTRLEQGMVGIRDVQIGNDPNLPATTVFELFCPNPACPARKPERHQTDQPGTSGDTERG